MSGAHEAPGIGRTYYVEVPLAVARAFWSDFQHELNFPAARFTVAFGEAEGEAARTRVEMHAADAADAGRMDEAMRRFRLFLASRGVARIEPPLE